MAAAQLYKTSAVETSSMAAAQLYKMSAVEWLSVSNQGATENAFSRRAGHASISTLDVRTDRL
jgi:hypothetical protein